MVHTAPERALWASGGVPPVLHCVWAPAWCALTPAAAGVRPRLLLLHHERRQYCGSANFDFAGAVSHLKNPEVIFKLLLVTQGSRDEARLCIF